MLFYFYILIFYRMASVSDLKKLCTPALIYLVIAIIGMLVAIRNYSLMSGLGSLVFVFLWTWFLNFLCSSGYTGVSWFLVVLPFVMFILTFLIALETATHITKNPALANNVHNAQM